MVDGVGGLAGEDGEHGVPGGLADGFVGVGGYAFPQGVEIGVSGVQPGQGIDGSLANSGVGVARRGSEGIGELGIFERGGAAGGGLANGDGFFGAEAGGERGYEAGVGDCAHGPEEAFAECDLLGAGASEGAEQGRNDVVAVVGLVKDAAFGEAGEGGGGFGGDFVVGVLEDVDERCGGGGVADVAESVECGEPYGAMLGVLEEGAEALGVGGLAETGDDAGGQGLLGGAGRRHEFADAALQVVGEGLALLKVCLGEAEAEQTDAGGGISEVAGECGDAFGVTGAFEAGGENAVEAVFDGGETAPGLTVFLDETFDLELLPSFE